MPRGKIRKWTEDEVYLLKTNAANMTITQLTQIINATGMQIRHYCKQNNIKYKPAYKTWTIQDLQIASNNPSTIAATILNRSIGSVYSRIHYAKKQIMRYNGNEIYDK